MIEKYVLICKRSGAAQELGQRSIVHRPNSAKGEGERPGAHNHWLISRVLARAKNERRTRIVVLVERGARTATSPIGGSTWAHRGVLSLGVVALAQALQLCPVQVERCANACSKQRGVTLQQL